MNLKPIVTAVIAAFFGISLPSNAADRQLVFVGSGRANIETFRFDTASGTLTPIAVAATIAHPSYFAIAPNHRFLCAITEGHGKSDSSISAFSIDAANGNLTPINSQPAGGAGPCYVEVDSTGKDALIANYGSGSVAVFPLAGNGELSPISAFIQDHGSSVNSSRQKAPHAHCIVTDPANRFAFVCDLGTDKIMIFKFDAGAGSLTANDPPFVTAEPGAGPRHIAFHPNGKWAYIINEMGCTVNAYSYDSTAGALREIQTIPTLPKDFTGQNTAAEIAVDPSGKFAFCSNRGDDSIVVFACDSETGRLRFIERDSTGGRTPRQFELDQTGAYLLAANQDSDTLAVFRIDKSTGHLQAVGAPIHTDNPMCVKCLKME